MTDEQLQQEAEKEYPCISYINDHDRHLKIHAYIAGIKSKAAAQYHAPKWISVEERLPEFSGLVLTYMKGTKDQYICYYRKQRNVFEVYGAGRDPIADMEVEAWMPLPTINPEEK